MRQFLILLICSLALAACTGKPAASQPARVNTPVMTASAAPTDTATVTPRPTLPATATPQPIPTTNIKAFELDNSLYLLAGKKDWNEGQDLYRLMPGAQAVEHLNPPGEVVTCFDLWNGGERLAFGTKQGKVYTQARGEPPRVLVDAALNSASPVRITGIRWSPDGQRLAYTVDLLAHELYKIPYPTRPSGLWVIDVQGKNPVWLISNNYVPPDAEYVSELRSFKDPIWSPDGTALIVHDGHWEGSERVWFDPIRPVKNDSTLIREGNEWEDAAWALDSQGVYLSGLGYSDFCDLLRLSRDGKQREVLIDGTKNELYIHTIITFQNRLSFMALEGYIMDRKGPFLYTASTQTDPIQWSKVDPEPVCPLNGILSMTKGPDDNEVSILCGRVLSRFSLAGQPIEHINLHSQLKTVTAPIIAIQWGVE